MTAHPEVTLVSRSAKTNFKVVSGWPTNRAQSDEPVSDESGAASGWDSWLLPRCRAKPGDFKVDPTPTDNVLFDLHTFAGYGKRGVLLLLSDSTNVDRSGYTESERAVGPRLEDLFVRSPRRLVISCFSSSIHRLQQILDFAHQYGRKVAFFGRSMTDTTEIAHDLGLLTIPDGVLLRPKDAMSQVAEKRGGKVLEDWWVPESSGRRLTVQKGILAEPGLTNGIVRCLPRTPCRATQCNGPSRK